MSVPVNFETWELRDKWTAHTTARYRAAIARIPAPRPIPPTMRLAIYDCFAARRSFCFMKDCGNAERVAMARGYEAYRRACASVEQ